MVDPGLNNYIYMSSHILSLPGISWTQTPTYEPCTNRQIGQVAAIQLKHHPFLVDSLDSIFMATITAATLGNTIGIAFLSVVGASMYALGWERYWTTNEFATVDCLAQHLFRRTCTIITTDEIRLSTNVPLVFFGILLGLRNQILYSSIWLSLLDTSHLALFVHAVYDYNVTQYGNREALYSITLSLKVFDSCALTPIALTTNGVASGPPRCYDYSARTLVRPKYWLHSNFFNMNPSSLYAHRVWMRW